MPNVFSIADDILITGFDEQGKDNNAALVKVLVVCRQANMKHNKDKCLFRCTSISFFGKKSSGKIWACILEKYKELTDLLSPKSKEELVILGYTKLSKVLQVTAEVC